MSAEFAGLTAVVTGAGSGIGLATAKILKERGATVYGLELEVRKHLGFLGDGIFSHLSFNGNATYVHSAIDLTSLAEQTKYLVTNTAIPQTRPMVGQSPYSINLGLSYHDTDRIWEGNLSYNVKGETLSIVGTNRTPDIYENPFNQLDAKISKQIGGVHGRKGQAATAFRGTALQKSRVSWIHFSWLVLPERTRTVQQPQCDRYGDCPVRNVSIPFQVRTSHP